MAAIITLTTDFGLADSYVAAMKGVILSINPAARLVDVSHVIKPQNVRQAAFVLSTAYKSFPPGTIHLAVVDPGVGTGRRAVILRTPSADFIAPDNGVLSHIIQPSVTPLESYGEQVKLGPGLEAVTISNPEFWRLPVSPTFHGRDIFAPVAAHLSLGRPLTAFGEAINSLTALPVLRPRQTAEGTISGHIQHIDNFGNLITDIRSSDLPRTGQPITIEVGNRRIHGVSSTYGEGKELQALIGSSDFLEVAWRDGNASVHLNASVGDEVRMRL